MVDLIVAPIRKMSEKQRRNISRNSRKKRLDIGQRKRVLARKKNHALFFRSLEETSADGNICNWIHAKHLKHGNIYCIA